MCVSGQTYLPVHVYLLLRRGSSLLIFKACFSRTAIVCDLVAQLVSASVDGQVRVWDLRSMRCVQVIQDDIGVGGGGNALNAIELCPSRQQLYCASQRLHVYEQVGAELMMLMPPGTYVFTLWLSALCMRSKA